MESSELIRRAAEALNPVLVDNRWYGDVAAALETETGSVFVGVCIDTPSWGICAERSAIAAMVAAREYRIKQIVAVWRDGDGRLHVLPPCGGCREFIRQVDAANVATQVILGLQRSATLQELVPYSEFSSERLDFDL